MKPGLSIALAALAMAVAAPATAQTIDWNSEANRTWWNGVTQAELQELVAEAGGTWRDTEDREGIRESRIDWPDLKDVLVREGECPVPERPMPERNCAAMLLAVSVPMPDDIEDWWVANEGWLAFGGVDEESALYRLERHGFGTTRGRVLASLMMFRATAVREIRTLTGMSSSGW